MVTVRTEDSLHLIHPSFSARNKGRLRIRREGGTSKAAKIELENISRLLTTFHGQVCYSGLELYVCMPISLC